MPEHSSWDEPHVPAEPDPGIAALLERVARVIADDRDHHGREHTTGHPPCPGADETS